MPVILTRRGEHTGLIKPEGKLRVQPGHPFAPDWCSLLDDLNQFPTDHVVGTRAKRATSTYNLMPTNDGLTGSVAANTTSNLYWNNPPVIGTGDFAVYFVGTLQALGLISVAFSNAGGGNQWRMQPNSNNAGSTEAAAFAFYTYDGAASIIGASSVIITDEVACWMGVRRGSTMGLWKNGIQLATGTRTARDIDSGKTGIGVGWNGNATWTASPLTHWKGYHSVGMFKGTITDDFAAEFSANPYLFLERRPRVHIVTGGAAVPAGPYDTFYKTLLSQSVM